MGIQWNREESADGGTIGQLSGSRRVRELKLTNRDIGK